MTRIIITGDWHADHRTGGIDRFADVEAAALQVRDEALRDPKVDLLLFLGDLADPEDGLRALRALGLAMRIARDLAQAGVHSWHLRGNHCVFEDGSGQSVITNLSLMGPYVRAVDEPSCWALPRRGESIVLEGETRAIVLLPYPAATKPYDPAAWVRRCRTEYGRQIVAVAGHMTEASGIEPGEESLEMSRGRGVPFPFAECDPKWKLFNGHFHRGQTFRTGPHELHIPGSLARLTHGEERSKPRFLVADV